MKYPHLFRLFLSGVLLVFPVSLFAQDIFSVTSSLYNILLGLGELFWALSVMLFIWGVVKFIANANDTTAHEEGKQFMIWGIVAFVVLVSLWGIVDVVLSGTFGITPGGPLNYILSN